MLERIRDETRAALGRARHKENTLGAAVFREQGGASFPQPERPTTSFSMTASEFRRGPLRVETGLRDLLDDANLPAPVRHVPLIALAGAALFGATLCFSNAVLPHRHENAIAHERLQRAP